MPNGTKPSVFVSSTCFDLGQVRVDLRQFLDAMGLYPVLSEFNSFPVNPDFDTIKNCREAVKRHADIFILIIGGRYGNSDDNGKSITNLEYIEAKAKGIPIYIFVAKNIVNILPVWKKNKEADFSTVVDNNKLFEFVESLRDTKDNWVFSFETAQDICIALKQQLAYLFKDCLNIRARITPGILDDKDLSDVSPTAIRIIIDKPRGWEYRFFAEVLKDYIGEYEDIRKDLYYGVSFGKRMALKSPIEVIDWVSGHCDNMVSAITSATRLLNEGLPVAFGEPGQPGNAKHIYYIAKRFMDGYKRFIEWRLEFLSLNVDGNFNRLLDLTSQMATNIIKEIEDYVDHIHKEINKVFDNIDEYKEGTEIRLTLTLTVPDTSAIYTELERLKRLYF